MDLFNHSVLENGGLSHDFNSHAIPCLRVSCELNLGEGAFANCSTHLILADLSPHLLHGFSTIIHLQFREDNLVETQLSPNKAKPNSVQQYSGTGSWFSNTELRLPRVKKRNERSQLQRVEMRRRIGILF